MYLGRILKPAIALVVLALDFLIIAPTVGAAFPRHYIVSPDWIGTGIFAICIAAVVTISLAFSAIFALISMVRARKRVGVAAATTATPPPPPTSVGF